MHDVIVVGLGAMGSAAAQHLAERGQRVLGLEQFAPLHVLGSSHGNSRMFRQSYWEHPAYVPLLLRAYELWERLERDTARTSSADAADLLHLTGGLVLGSHSGDLVARSRLAAEQHHLPHQILEAADLRRRFPQFAATEDTYALFEARAGYLRAAHCLRAQFAAAIAHGADLHFHSPVLAWRVLPDSTIEVITPIDTYRADRLVLTAGPWAAQHLLAAAALPLTVTRQILFWFEAATHPGLFREPGCPVYIFEPTAPISAAGPTPVLYGFPETLDDPGTVKVALHGSPDIVPPEALDHPARPERPGSPDRASREAEQRGKTDRPRKVKISIDRTAHPHEIAGMRDRLRSTLPALATGRLAHAETCLYTMTPDEHFLIDRHPTYPSVTLAAGFSGHGFKFANLIGEILADLSLTGRTPHSIDLFALARFAEPPSPTHA